jgi:hypothetical protein
VGARKYLILIEVAKLINYFVFGVSFGSSEIDFSGIVGFFSLSPFGFL